MLVKEDGFVRWQDPARAVVDRYRGVAAWPQTTAFLGGARLKLGGLEPARGAGAPGEVLRVEADGVVIACGDGRRAGADCAARGAQSAARRRVGLGGGRGRRRAV